MIYSKPVEGTAVKHCTRTLKCFSRKTDLYMGKNKKLQNTIPLRLKVEMLGMGVVILEKREIYRYT